jgi:hypothetical protein
MSTFRTAVQAVMETVGNPDAWSVERVDVDPKGPLHLTCSREGHVRWFRYEGADLEEVFPTDDSRLPACKLLGESDNWSILSYRPGRRIVLDVQEEGRRIVRKGFRKRRSEPAARLHESATGCLQGAGLGIPRLLAHDSSTEALTFEWIESSAVDLGTPSIFEALGRSLGSFQRTSSDIGLADFGPEAELEVLDRWAKRFALVQDELPARWHELRERAESLLPDTPSSDLGPCHRDLHDGQILSSANGLLLLDFDLLCRADRALDVGNLLTHFTLRSLQNLPYATPATAEACTRALLDGLDWSSSDPVHRRVRFYQATTFLRLSLVYGLRPKWAHLSPRLVEMAEPHLG